MKSLAKFQGALEVITNAYESKNTCALDTAISLLKEFLIDNEPTPRTSGGNIFSICSTESARISLQGVYHDPTCEMACACGSHILVMTKADYNPEYAGKIVTKYGKEINAKYPSFRGVIPNGDGYDKTFTIDVDVCRRAIKEKNAKLNIMRANARTRKESTVTIQVMPGYFADANDLLKVAGFATEFKAGENNRAFYMKDDEKTVLFMPKYLNGIEDGDTHTAFATIGGEHYPLF